MCGKEVPYKATPIGRRRSGPTNIPILGKCAMDRGVPPKKQKKTMKYPFSHHLPPIFPSTLNGLTWDQSRWTSTVILYHNLNSGGKLGSGVLLGPGSSHVVPFTSSPPLPGRLPPSDRSRGFHKGRCHARGTLGDPHGCGQMR